jgi:hypothetical protein
VTLEMVQHASFLIPSFGEDNRLRRAGRAPEAITTWVCKSSPVTMFPTDRSAGVWTAVDGCLRFSYGNVEAGRAYMRRSTRRLATPDSMTAWILSLVPSDK